MSRLRVIRPRRKYYDSFLSACREAHELNVSGWQPVAPEAFTRWKRTAPLVYFFLRAGLFLPDGVPRMETYWIMDGDTFAAELQLRPYISDDQAIQIGHMGVGVRPGLWGRGFGTQAVRWGIRRLRELGVQQICYICDPENGASTAIAEACGFTRSSYRTLDGQGCEQSVYILR